MIKNERFIQRRAGFVEIVMQLGEMGRIDFDSSGCRTGLQKYNLDLVGCLPPREANPGHRFIMVRWPIGSRGMSPQDAFL